MSHNKLTQEQVINQFIKVHRDLYDYSKVNYIDSWTKVIITCPIHGDFKQEPRHHKSGAGCPKCKGGVRLDITYIISEFNLIHNNFYSYSKTKYTDLYPKVIITCPIHGDFNQNLLSHKSGVGCPKCKSGGRYDRDYIVNLCMNKHKNQCDYTDFVYTTMMGKSEFKCNTHGYFKQRVDSHINSGCPYCSYDKIHKDKPTYVYFLHIKDNIYKIGITIDIETRLNQLTNTLSIKVLKSRLFSTYSEAYEYEQRLLHRFRKYKYEGPNLLWSGNTELIQLIR